MAWTDKARAASAASRRAKAGPKKLGAKAAAWRKAGDASNASRVSERGWGSGKGITKRGSLARRSNKERAKAVKSGATKKANTLIHRVIKGTPPSAVSPKRENYGNSFLQRQQDATYSKLAKNHANRSTMRLFNTGPYSINKNRLSNPVSGVAKGNAVTETGDATTSKAVRKSNRRTGKGAINGTYSARTGRSVIDGGRNSGYWPETPRRRKKGK